MLVVRESDKVMCVNWIKREKDEEINGHQQAMTKKKMREEINKWKIDNYTDWTW